MNPDGTGNVDYHDFLTGTGSDGNLYVPGSSGSGPGGGLGGNGTGTFTCNDWTSSEEAANTGPSVGHSWGAGSGEDWKSALREGGAGINLQQQGGPKQGVYTGGTGGGYGGIYCLALAP